MRRSSMCSIYLSLVIFWSLRTAIPIFAHGQAFAWDRGQPGLIYSIDRKTNRLADRP